MRRIAALAILAAGCTTVGPDYKRPAIELPAQFPAGDPADARLAPSWWTLYRDATLDELVAAAQKNNADVRLAAARVREAEAVLREANAAFFPELNATASGSRARVSQQTLPPSPRGVPLVRPNYLFSLSTSFELDFWGRFARASEAARANLLATRLGQDVVALGLAGSTAQAYFALRSFDAQITVLNNSLKLRNDSLAIAQARLDAGLASELDVYQAQGAVADALVQRRDAERGRALLERQLGQLVGRLDLKIRAGDLFALPVPPTPPAGLPSALLERRPDIRSAEESLVAANAQIGVARAAMFPTISLTAAAGTQSVELNNLFQGGDRKSVV